MEAYLDVKEYGVWLDGKRIQNDELKNYEAKDFHHAFKSRLARNAKNYGVHTYQVGIYTMDYFRKEYGNEEGKWWIEVNLDPK